MHNEYTHKSLMSGRLCKLTDFENGYSILVDSAGEQHKIPIHLVHLSFAPLYKDETHDDSI